jgi:D-erythronate 2-dehydrogenase
MGIRVLVTGADGFVGRTLVKMLLESSAFEVSSLRLMDRQFKIQYGDARVQLFSGDFFDPDVLKSTLENSVDIAFHLASIPGGAAERDFELGHRVNLDGTLELFEALRQQAKTPVVVFASTIAVYGSPLPALVDANTPVKPNLSYGTQKLIGELMLEDFSRRGFLDGRAVRLPGIVARPLEPSGLISAFMSDVMRCLSAGEAFTCPVSPEAIMWWMSAQCCAQNLIHAATMPVAPQARQVPPSGQEGASYGQATMPIQQGSSRVTLLPALRATMGEIVAGIAELYGSDRLGLIRYEPNEQVEAGFGRFPPMDSSAAEALGFQHDGSVIALIKNALQDVVGSSPPL